MANNDFMVLRWTTSRYPEQGSFSDYTVEETNCSEAGAQRVAADFRLLDGGTRYNDERDFPSDPSSISVEYEVVSEHKLNEREDEYARQCMEDLAPWGAEWQREQSERY